MDEHSRRIASELVLIQEDHLGPLYDRLREELAGSLGAASLHHQTLQEQSEQRAQNRKWLEGFVSLLPAAEYVTQNSRVGFRADDAYTSRAIQAATVDMPYYPLPAFWSLRLIPHYLIGGRSLGEEKAELLLYNAHLARTDKFITPFAIAGFGRDAAAQFNAHARESLTKMVSPEEVEAMYDHRSKGFWVTPRTKLIPSLLAPEPDPGSKPATRRFFSRLTPPLEPTPRPITSQAGDYYFDNVDLKDLKFGPTDLEMAQFSILERCGELAVLFAVTDQYRELLGNKAHPDEA